MKKYSISILNTTIQFQTHSDELIQLISGFIKNYPKSTRTPQVIFRLDKMNRNYILKREMNSIYIGTQKSVFLELLEEKLITFVVSQCQGLTLHAAALEVPQGALLIIGQSGTGKSTLTLNLLSKGARYISDECVHISENKEVTGIPRPINFRPSPIFPTPPHEFNDIGYDCILKNSTKIRRSFLQLAPQKVTTASIPLHRVIFLLPNWWNIYKEPPIRSSSESFIAIWGCTWRQNVEALKIAASLIRSPGIEHLSGKVDLRLLIEE